MVILFFPYYILECVSKALVNKFQNYLYLATDVLF